MGMGAGMISEMLDFLLLVEELSTVPPQDIKIVIRGGGDGTSQAQALRYN